MKYQTKGIILKRLNYGEADRIITFLSPDLGKLSAIAKGVRKTKSKLAGGIELFSISDLGLVKGRGKLDTLISTRLDKYFENIITDYDRIQVAYWSLKMVNKMTDEVGGGEYYSLIASVLELLNDLSIDHNVSACWFYMQIMRLNGSLPNLLTDTNGDVLKPKTKYRFIVDDGNFSTAVSGVFGENEIKAWRVFINALPKQLKTISGLEKPAQLSVDTLRSFSEFQI